MSRNRPNTTQRSWSNYVGDKPIKSWVGKAPVSSDARYYVDSYMYGPGAGEEVPTENKESEKSDWVAYVDPMTGKVSRKKKDQKRRRTLLEEARRNVGRNPEVTGIYDPENLMV